MWVLIKTHQVFNKNYKTINKVKYSTQIKIKIK